MLRKISRIIFSGLWSIGLVFSLGDETAIGKTGKMQVTFDCAPPFVHRMLCGKGHVTITDDGKLIFEGPRGPYRLQPSIPVRRITRDAFFSLGLDRDLELIDLVRARDLFFLSKERADAIERVDAVTLKVAGIPDDTEAPFIVSSFEVTALVPNISAHPIRIWNPRAIRPVGHHYQITSLDDDWRENVVRLENVDYGIYVHGFDPEGRALVTFLSEMRSFFIGEKIGTREALKIYAVARSKIGIRLEPRLSPEPPAPPETEVVLRLAMPTKYKAWEPLVRTIRAELNAKELIRFTVPTFRQQLSRYLKRCEVWIASFRDRRRR